MKKFIIHHFPFVGAYKRFFVALVNDLLPMKKSYSQHGEDRFILETLKNFNLENSVYVDVGANHPSSISNTYLLYRNDMSGIIIEPNQELIQLFKVFRKKDIKLMLGCSDVTAVKKLFISKTPALSTFDLNHKHYRDKDLHRVRYLPVLKLDDVLTEMDMEFINLLSIDVEGLNVEVLKGSKKSLERTLMLCIEFDYDNHINVYTDILGEGFELVEKFGCNAIFLNKALQKQHKV